MKFADPSRWLPIFQWSAGLCDTATGALLVLAPAWTLKLLGLQRPPQPVEFASFVGVFVLGVGLAYLSIARLPLSAEMAPRWQTGWALTALIRALVAVFLTWQILAGRMEQAWLTVAATDGTLAVFQCIGLKRGWLDFKD